jgi:Domain of unknown function (DUF4403)
MPRTVVVIVTVLFIVPACRVIQPHPPVLPPVALEATPLPDSRIDLPLTIDLDSVYTDIDREIPMELSGEGKLGPAQYQWTLQRKPFEIATDTLLHFDDQAQGTLTAYVKNPLNKKLSKVGDCHFDVDFGFVAQLALTEHYSLDARLRLTRLEAKACNLQVAGVDAAPDIQSILTSTLQEALTRLEGKLRQQNLTKLIQPYWAKLFRPIRFGDLGYLSLNPSQIRLENFSGSAHALSAAFGITARPIFSLTNPGPPSSIPPLPVITQSNDTGFHVYIDARIQYTELNRLLEEHVDNQKMPVGAKSYIMIQNAEVYGSGNNHLLVRVDFKGRQSGIGYKGTLYFTCLPVYDPKTGQFYISEIEFDTYTKEKLQAKAGGWILNSAIKTILHDQLHFNLGDQLNGIRDEVNASLNQPIDPNFQLTGKVDTLVLVGILPVKDHILVRLHAEGTLGVLLK